jgi:hypothetical protein
MGIPSVVKVDVKIKSYHFGIPSFLTNRIMRQLGQEKNVVFRMKTT